MVKSFGLYYPWESGTDGCWLGVGGLSDLHTEISIQYDKNSYQSAVSLEKLHFIKSTDKS